MLPMKYFQFLNHKSPYIHSVARPTLIIVHVVFFLSYPTICNVIGAIMIMFLLGGGKKSSNGSLHIKEKVGSIKQRYTTMLLNV